MMTEGEAGPRPGNAEQEPPAEGAPATKRLEDPRTMRALAHPLRLRLLSLLRTDGPATVSALAEAVDEAVALVSYHLLQLAGHGFIEEAPELARDKRERWWRASHERTTWSSLDFLDSPERRAAAGAFRREVLRLYAALLEEYLEEEPAWGEEWIAAADSSDLSMRLTPEELRALRDDVFEVLERWERHGKRAPERDGAEMVQVIVHAFPRRRPAP